jgi:hypothetical protein
MMVPSVHFVHCTPTIWSNSLLLIDLISSSSDIITWNWQMNFLDANCQAHALTSTKKTVIRAMACSTRHESIRFCHKEGGVPSWPTETSIKLERTHPIADGDSRTLPLDFANRESWWQLSFTCIDKQLANSSQISTVAVPSDSLVSSAHQSRP